MHISVKFQYFQYISNSSNLIFCNMFYDVLRIFTLLLLEKMPFPGTSGSKPSQKLKVQGLLLACQEDVLRLVDFGHKIRAALQPSHVSCHVFPWLRWLDPLI